MKEKVRIQKREQSISVSRSQTEMGKEGECLGYAADCETICLAFSETSEVFFIFFSARSATHNCVVLRRSTRSKFILSLQNKNYFISVLVFFLFFVFFFFLFLSFLRHLKKKVKKKKIFQRSERNAQLRCAPKEHAQQDV